jgi:ribosomal protein S18 acetylase RimI-like enzyme
VARTQVVVRPATPDDLSDLLAMWREHLDLSMRGERALPQPSEAGVLARLREAQGNPDIRIVVATIGTEVVGMALLTHQPLLAFFDADAVHLHYLHVRSGHRQRGVGHALIAAAAAYADETGADHLMTNVSPHLREANRFYARLGFTPMVVRRSVALPVLRRRLAGGGAAARTELLSRRRSMRTRAASVRQALARIGD